MVTECICVEFYVYENVCRDKVVISLSFWFWLIDLVVVDEFVFLGGYGKIIGLFCRISSLL